VKKDENKERIKNEIDYKKEKDNSMIS